MSSKPQYQSPNFQFLEKIDPLLAELGARAERYALDDPNTSMIKVRQLGELLAKLVASKNGIQADSRNKDQRTLIDELFRARAITAEIQSLFHTIRMEGNDANHAMQGHEGQAITLLRHARKIAVWAYRSYIDGRLKLGGSMNQERRIKLFRNGSNQAIRIPKEFELPGDEAILSVDADRLIIEAVKDGNLISTLREMGPLNEDFPDIDDFEADLREPDLDP